MSKHNVVKPVCDIDFLQNADNVYRTPDYIVKQKISLCSNNRGDVHSVSDDTYYFRTSERDIDYEFVFHSRNNLDGKRIKTRTYLRTYID